MPEFHDLVQEPRLKSIAAATRLDGWFSHCCMSSREPNDPTATTTSTKCQQNGCERVCCEYSRGGQYSRVLNGGRERAMRQAARWGSSREGA